MVDIKGMGLLLAVLSVLLVLFRSAEYSLADPSQIPLVIGHRGASGYLPEHTLEAYELAIDQGADYIEPDLVISKDGVLFARHENELSGTTDVALKFPDRRTSKKIDGRIVFGWFLEDFTAAEIETLRARERLRFRNQSKNDLFGIPTFEEILALIRRRRAHSDRRIGVYAEIKHSTYFRSIGLPLEEPLLELLKEFGYDRPGAAAFIQSFEVSNLKALKGKTRVSLIQLLGKPGRRPYDLVARGDPRTYGDLATLRGLEEIARYARGIGAEKLWLQAPDPGNPRGPPGALIERAHQAGLLVHAYTFRNEPRYAAANFVEGPQGEYFHFFGLGVDGVFSDFPDTAVAARSAFLAAPQYR